MSSKPNQNSDVSALRSRWLQNGDSGSSLRDEMLQRLKSECVLGGSNRPVNLDLRGILLNGEDLTGLDLSGYDFSDADLSGSNLTKSRLSQCTMLRTSLENSILIECELFEADLSDAKLSECNATQAGFGGVNLTNASLFGANLEKATLSSSDLSNADFRGANLTSTRIVKANCARTDFSRAILQDTDMSESVLHGASFDNADLREARLSLVSGFAKATWYGADIRLVDFNGAYLVRRHIMDENYLMEYRSRDTLHKWIYRFWWLTSDCGRSVVRWSMLTGIIVLFFAGLYTLVDIDYGDYETPLSPIYYSIVTLTTLGYGDSLPASTAAQIVASCQAIVGYVALGGLLGILANKMVRRAD